jgi:hypothetical protein
MRLLWQVDTRKLADSVEVTGLEEDLIWIQVRSHAVI